MSILPPVTAEELPRLERAVAQAADYTLERLPGSDACFVRKDGASYLTCETACGCEDFRKGNGEGKPLRRCKHVWLVKGLLDLRGRVTVEQKTAQALSDRAALWA